MALNPLTDTTTDIITNTSTASGNKLVVTPSTSGAKKVGEAVTDVIFNPFIASRVISFYAYNMRPNTLVHVFFDSVLVDKYCAPGTATNGLIADSSDYTSIKKNGNWGDPIVTDDFGTVAGQFNIPKGTFKFGERILTIADTDNLTTTQDAITTQASGQFTGSNITVNKEAITLTTITPEISYIPVSCTVVTSTKSTNIVVHPNDVVINASWYEPIAQGLTINTPNGEAGIYATSIDIYFKQKSKGQKNGVTVYLCEINNGYPDGKKVLPFSTVHLPWSNVAIGTPTGNYSYSYYNNSTQARGIDNDATTFDKFQWPTNFKFESPVFMNNNTEYAVVVKPDNGDPDYWVYSAELGFQDFQTDTKVYSQPVIGTAFYGATDFQWTALQKEYIKFNLYRAEFNKQAGDAYFYNDDMDYIKVFNMGFACTTYSVLPGDYVYQSKNSYSNSTGGTANTSIKGIVNYYDATKQILYVANSSGNWPLTANNLQIHRFQTDALATSPGPNTVTLVAYANTSGLYDPKVNAVVPQISKIVPAGTLLGLSYKGTSNSYNVDTKEINVTSGTETDLYDYERLVVSKSKEVSSMSSAKSFNLHANLVTSSSLLSPMIDTVSYKELVIGNQIDPITFIYDEFFNNGPSQTKYVSKIITLAAGQDAEDLNVILTAWRPPGTDIQVWIKFLNSQDGDPISAKTWTPLVNSSGSLYSDPGNPTNYNEYVFTVPPYYTMISTNGTITATASCTAITGVNTKFQTELKPGWYINMAATATTNETTRKVVSIASNTSLTLDQGFNYSYSAGTPYYLVPPPTTPWMASNTTTQINGVVSTSTTNNTITGYGATFYANTTSVNNSANSILITNANTYYSVNQRVYYYVPAGNTALTGLTGNSYYFIATSNTTAITLNPQQGNTTPITITGGTTNPGQTHSLNTTFFDVQTQPGNILIIANNPQAIVSIANGTSLTVGKPALSAVSYANAYISTPNGLSYLNGTNALYSTFIKFQIKVILQSNDSSKPPFLSNIRALALQL